MIQGHPEKNNPRDIVFAFHFFMVINHRIRQKSSTLYMMIPDVIQRHHTMNVFNGLGFIENSHP